MKILVTGGAGYIGSIASEQLCKAALGDVLARQMKLAASAVTVVVLKDTGHWVLEERPKETTDALLKFL